jgi:predicted RNase H-like nuclease (RuvC/YqgF family)
LACKLGNFEASFNRHLETQNIKLSGEIGCLNVQEQRNGKTAEELKLSSTEVNKELVTIKTKISELKTELINTKQKVDHLSLYPEKATTIKDKIMENGNWTLNLKK